MTCCDRGYGHPSGRRTLPRTLQVRLGSNPLQLLGGKPIFTVSRQQFMKHPELARISPAATAEMAILPGVLGPHTLRRSVQVRLGSETLRLPGGKLIFTVS